MAVDSEGSDGSEGDADETHAEARRTTQAILERLREAELGLLEHTQHLWDLGEQGATIHATATAAASLATQAQAIGQTAVAKGTTLSKLLDETRLELAGLENSLQKHAEAWPHSRAEAEADGLFAVRNVKKLLTIVRDGPTALQTKVANLEEEMKTLQETANIGIQAVEERPHEVHQELFTNTRAEDNKDDTMLHVSAAIARAGGSSATGGANAGCSGRATARACSWRDCRGCRSRARRGQGRLSGSGCEGAWGWQDKGG